MIGKRVEFKHPKYGPLNGTVRRILKNGKLAVTTTRPLPNGRTCYQTFNVEPSIVREVTP